MLASEFRNEVRDLLREQQIHSTNLDWERLVDKRRKVVRRTVCQLEFSLRFELVVERNNDAFGLLVHEHGMPMTECSSANVLTGNADIISFEQEGAECKCLGNMYLSQMVKSGKGRACLSGSPI